MGLPGTGINDANGLASDVIGRVEGLCLSIDDRVLGATDRGGVRWTVGYHGDALAAVAIKLRYMPEASTQPSLIVPAPDGLGGSITMADAR